MEMSNVVSSTVGGDSSIDSDGDRFSSLCDPILKHKLKAKSVDGDGDPDAVLATGCADDAGFSSLIGQADARGVGIVDSVALARVVSDLVGKQTSVPVEKGLRVNFRGVSAAGGGAGDPLSCLNDLRNDYSWGSS
ncbi:hypothetical protein Dimus_033497 [Dionaea muscipula]